MDVITTAWRIKCKSKRFGIGRHNTYIVKIKERKTKIYMFFEPDYSYHGFELDVDWVRDNFSLIEQVDVIGKLKRKNKHIFTSKYWQDVLDNREGL